MKSKSLQQEKVERILESEKTSDSSFIGEAPKNNVETAEFDEFGSLRLLLLSQEQSKISQLEAKVKTLQSQLDTLPPATSKEVSDVLPKAIKHRNKIDNQLSKATLPIVVDNIRQSVKENPQILAEALFPAIGPAIRKAIAEALATMVQSLNQTIEYSFSPRSIKWRLEAFQTGKSFAEVVLIKTLLYRVEEIFLIHKETGLLIQHVSANIGKGQDADMVSAMLTAIQDFVRDSFSNSADANLDTLTLGELSVWIERSQDLLFAAVIRGNAPLSLREKFQTSLEEIVIDQEDEINNFQGEVDSFERSRPVLQECLQYQLGNENQSRGKVTPFNFGVAFIGLLLCVAGIFWFIDYWRWTSYVADLKNQKGIVVTETERGWFYHSVQGLRDPTAADPINLLKTYSLNSEKTFSRWEEYQSSNPEIILKRANFLLNPPKDVSLTFADGILLINGNATKQWVDNAKLVAAAIVGIKEVRTNNVSINDLKEKLEALNVFFVCKSVDYEKDQNQTISDIANQLTELKNVAKTQNINIRFESQGNADGKGSTDTNNKISLKRAEKLAESVRSISPDLKDLEIKPNGLGATEKVGCSASIEATLEQ